MLKYILCLILSLHITFSYGSEDSCDDFSRIRQQAFFKSQNNDLQKAIHEGSIIYEMKQRLLYKGIQMLQLPTLDIQIGGKELSKKDLEILLAKQSTKFTNENVKKVDEIVDEFDGTVANTLILINLRAKKKLEDGSTSEPHTISFFTTVDVFLASKNLAEYCDQLAILNEWAYYSDFTIAIIPKGARLQAMIGLTAVQESKEKQFKEIVKEVGKEQALYYTAKIGGAPQIYIAHASEYYVYDIGSISMNNFSKIRVENVINDQFPIYLPLVEFLQVRFHDSFKKFHDTVNTIYQTPYYAYPFSILNSEFNEFTKLFYYSRQNHNKIALKPDRIPFSATSHANTKAIAPYKERPKAPLVLHHLPTKRAAHTSLHYAYIAPLIRRSMKMF